MRARRRVDIARTVTVCAALGGLSAVGVAWMGEIAFPGPPPVSTSGPSREWLFPPATGWPSRCSSRRLDRTLLRDVHRAYRQQSGTGQRVYFEQYVVRSGFPFRCVTRRESIESGRPAGSLQDSGLRYLERGIPLPVERRPTSPAYRLALVPVWPGLAINTALCALAWWAVIAVARLARQNARYGRGLCPMCGYDLKRRYTPGCTECGWRR